ncbi:MAG: methylenetetrahydrofolate reductase [Candidatus Marinimicrobia bacterium]|nr:methylenetetrahydrofolate reductase [Candidatus Neomarinimicrobiota bacterium]
MKVIEHIERAQSPEFSFEIIPPPRGKSAQEIIDIVTKLQHYNPPYIDVTSHSAEAIYDDLADGTIKRRIKKKRPGTISICGIIQNRFNIDTVAHLLCRGFTREETEDALIELNYLGIQNVLAIRGDETNYKKPLSKDKSINPHTKELVEQINNMNRGKYLDEILDADATDFCVGVGGYPEKHFEAPNLKTDIKYLKTKLDAGADYIVTQMVFDNTAYFRFVEECKAAGINVPIIPGIKVINRLSQLNNIPRNFHVDLPDALVDEIRETPGQVREIGFEWAYGQCRELLEAGVKNLHFYIMNDTGVVTRIIDRLK